jgi:hypothetical protein
MPIQIIDNFNLTLSKPIDNRFVVGSQSFYTTKDSIGYKYPGMRIWDLNDGIPYVWTGTTFSSENSVSISGSGTPNYLAKFSSSNVIGNSLLFDNGTNIGISEASPTYKLDVDGDIRAQSGFIGDGSLITNINASSITSGNLGLSRIQLTPGVSGNILLHAGGSAQWVSPSSLSVGTASALQTTRTIWGQNFNGTGNITGNIVGAGTIQFGSQILKATISYNVNNARTLTVPSLSGNRTFAFIDESQTFSANNTFSGNNAFSGSNILKVADGTLSTPSIAFNGDIDTGIYRVNTNQFALVVGGVNMINIGSSGYTRAESGLDLRNGLHQYTTTSLSYSSGKNLIEAGEFVYTAGGIDVYQWWQRIGKSVSVSFKIVGTLSSSTPLNRPILKDSPILGIMNYGTGNYNTPGIVSSGGSGNFNWIIKNSSDGAIPSADLVMGFYSYLL